MTTIADALEEASRVGVTKLVVAISLSGGYSEHGDTPLWSCVGEAGPKRIASCRGYTCEDAIVSVLAELGVTW